MRLCLIAPAGSSQCGLFPRWAHILGRLANEKSPRWLAAKGRMAEAEAVFTKLHGNGDPNNALVKLQMEEIKESLLLTESEKALRWWDFQCLFNSHQARWRTLQVTLMCFAGQWTGNGIGYFYVRPLSHPNLCVCTEDHQPVMYAGGESSTNIIAADKQPE